MSATSGSDSRTRTDSDAKLSSRPTISAKAGAIGRMYDGSLDLEALKNSRMNAAHTRTKRGQQKPLRSTGACVRSGSAS